MSDITVRGKELIVGAALGNCVHVAGVAHFLRLAEDAGFQTLLLGAATPIARILEAVDQYKPCALAISYRLTPSNGRPLLEELMREMEGRSPIVLFGGTPEMVRIARQFPRISACFSGDENMSKVRQVFGLLRKESYPELESGETYPPVPIEKRVDSLMRAGDREQHIPLLRHHFGLPDLDATVRGVRQIAEASVLDVISIAPDQNAQEFFFRQEQMDHSLDGAGGVPLRTPDHLKQLYDASRCGNYPYLRIYSGTQDLLKWAEMSVENLHNAWGTIPLTWYSELDGRSRRSIEEAIIENASVMHWYAQRDIPVEVNESHHWSLRDAPDTVAVAMAYIAARVAKKAGVRRFFAQYMFNTPSFTSPTCDLAKMLVKLALIESLRTESFLPYRQVRAGLSHFSTNLDAAKGQLAMSTAVMLALKPHIIHVVGFCEGDHAATAEDVIESCRIVHGVMRNAFLGMPSLLADTRVWDAYDGLLRESLLLIGTIERFGMALGSSDPLTDPVILAKAIRCGILDAPHLAGQPCAMGTVRTSPLNGGCRAVDSNGQPLSESERLEAVLRHHSAQKLVPGDPSRLISKFDVVLPVSLQLGHKVLP
jgi:hypothetical protein